MFSMLVLSLEFVLDVELNFDEEEYLIVIKDIFDKVIFYYSFQFVSDVDDDILL